MPATVTSSVSLEHYFGCEKGLQQMLSTYQPYRMMSKKSGRSVSSWLQPFAPRMPDSDNATKSPSPNPDRSALAPTCPLLTLMLLDDKASVGRRYFWYGIVRQVFSYPSANEPYRNTHFSSHPLRSCSFARDEALRRTYPSDGHFQHSRRPGARTRLTRADRCQAGVGATPSAAEIVDNRLDTWILHVVSRILHVVLSTRTLNVLNRTCSRQSHTQSTIVLTQSVWSIWW